MKRDSRKTYVFWIAITNTVGFLSGWLSQEGIAAFDQAVAQPPLSPPAIVFPIVWTILYTLMGISAARVTLRPASPAQNKGLNVYIAQLIINFFWSLIFFNAKAYGLAALWLLLLLALVLWMILLFRKADPLAAVLQIPYLIWLIFAAYLSIGIWYLNK